MTRMMALALAGVNEVAPEHDARRPSRPADRDHIAAESIALRDEQHVTPPKGSDSFEQHGPIFDPALPRRTTVHEHAYHFEPKASSGGSHGCLLCFEAKTRFGLLIGRDPQIGARPLGLALTTEDPWTTGRRDLRRRIAADPHARCCWGSWSSCRRANGLRG